MANSSLSFGLLEIGAVSPSSEPEGDSISSIGGHWPETSSVITALLDSSIDSIGSASDRSCREC